MVDQIIFGSKTIDFTLEYKVRKSLGITVTPEGQVLVKAPIGVDANLLNSKLKKKAPWILKQQEYFQSFKPKISKRKFISGETHLYMGRQYRLKTTKESIGEGDSVLLKGGFLQVFNPDTSRIPELIKNWYKSKAEIKIKEIAEPIISSFTIRHKINIDVKVTFREMKKRWGSCTSKGKIILNPELIKAPKPCIEYVIIHELCHLVCHDHNNKFYKLQSKEMKDWKKWKAKLEKLLA